MRIQHNTGKLGVLDQGLENKMAHSKRQFNLCDRRKVGWAEAARISKNVMLHSSDIQHIYWSFMYFMTLFKLITNYIFITLNLPFIYHYIITFGVLFFDLQTLFPAPAPLGPVSSACWQLRTEQWHSGPPLHKPGWEARRTYIYTHRLIHWTSTTNLLLLSRR